MDHENEIFLKFVILANLLGYRYAAYGLELPTSVAEPSFSLFANYAPDWQSKYVERCGRHHGSSVACGKRTRPADYHAQKYHWQRHDFEREAEQHHIIPEWVEQSAGEGGSITFVALADRVEPISPGFNQRVRVLIDLAGERMRRVLLGKYLPQAYIRLREVDRIYLAWVLDGKTAGEIADIMAITKPAVENLARKLQEKFDKKGIAATAFLAYRLGLLEAPQAASGAGS